MSRNINLPFINDIYSNHQKLSNEQYIARYLITKVETLTALSNSLHSDGIQMPAWKTYSETTIIKICFHFSSLFKLFHGTQLPFHQTEHPIYVFDEPSIYSLFRTITENYLTFYYLFIDSISDDEKHFRFLIYEYCGIKQRQSFPATTPDTKEKQKNEAAHLIKLKAAIESSQFFKKIDKALQRKIIDGIQPRLKSWKKLMREAQLNLGFDSNLYGFKSSYSHTEYLSLMQIRIGNYGYIPNQRKGHFVLFIIHMLICRIIVDIANLFPSIGIYYNKLDERLKMEIEFLSNNLKTDLNSLSST